MGLLYTRGYQASIGEEPVSGSHSISTGDPVAIDGSGYLKKAVDAASITFVGVAVEDADNTSGTSGAITCRFVKSPAEVSLQVTGSVPSYGTTLYVNTSGLVSSASGSNSVQVGTAQDADEDRSDYVWVKIRNL